MKVDTGFGIEIEVIKHEDIGVLTTITNHLAKMEYVI